MCEMAETNFVRGHRGVHCSHRRDCVARRGRTRIPREKPQSVDEHLLPSDTQRRQQSGSGGGRAPDRNQRCSLATKMDWQTSTSMELCGWRFASVLGPGFPRNQRLAEASATNRTEKMGCCFWIPNPWGDREQCCTRVGEDVGCR